MSAFSHWFSVLLNRFTVKFSGLLNMSIVFKVCIFFILYFGICPIGVIISASGGDTTQIFYNRLRGAVKERGIDIDSIRIIQADYCRANAKVVDGTIELCKKFFKYEFKDQVSIVWHEAYHIQNDNVWSKTEYRISPPVYLENVPQSVKDYINNVINADLEPEYSKKIGYDYEISVRTILDPVYYENEIRAYQAEIDVNKDVTPEYDAERQYMLWKHKQAYSLSKKYYNR